MIMERQKIAPNTKALIKESSVLIKDGQYDRAQEAIELYLKSNPYDAPAWAQRALLLVLTGQDELALDAANIALKIDNACLDAWTMQGNALMQLGKFSQALTSYEESVRLAPQVAISHYNKANALRSLGLLTDAISSAKVSLRLAPKQTNTITLMGALQKEIGNLSSAKQFFDEAIALDANAADAHYNRALLYLAIEQFQLGWQDYEWRLRWNVTIRQGQSQSIERLAPDWHGEATARPLLVIPEQGIGDQIFFSGMLPDLQHVAPGSMVCVEPRLRKLFTRSFPEIHFLTPSHINTHRSEYEGRFAAQVHIGSLGRFFRTDSTAFKNVTQGYLKPNETLTDQFKASLRQPGKLMCGVSWKSKNNEFGQSKSLTLAELAPLLRNPKVEFVNLQYGDTSIEISELKELQGIAIEEVNSVDKFHDIDSLAALINACDIVLTVSNTTAHLAAALGKPVIVMLPNSPSLFWYWHRNRSNSPWYPSAVLLRQSISGQWDDVIETAQQALSAFINASMT